MKNLYTLTYVLVTMLTLSVTSSFAQYCTPIWGGYGCTDDDDIDDFSTTGGITNISNLNTGCQSGITSYSYITNQVLTANPNSTINFTVGCSGIWSDAFRIWIDWNNDQDFLDAGEDVWNSVTASTLPFNGSFTIPLTAVSGVNLRMRVRCNYSSIPLDPCASQTYGEVEDYNLLVSPTVPNDAGVSAILSPVSDCDGSNQDVVVTVKNYGINQINNVTVHWTLNSVTQPNYLLSTLLDTANGTGPNTANATIGNITMVGGNPYNIVAWTENPNNQTDPNDYNDTSYANAVGYNYPVINLGLDTTTCPNDFITLDAGSGRDSIKWDHGATSRYLLADTARNYSVSVWKNGCGSMDNINVYFYPAPPTVNLGNDTMICYGDYITLDATAPGVTYLWHDNTTSATHIADTVGKYSVTIEDANTCKNYDEINVSLFSTPIISMSVVPRNTICFGAPFEFRANSFTQGSTMYQWKINTVNFGTPTTNNKFSPTLAYGDSVNVELLTDVCSSTTFAVPSNYITMYLKPEPKLISGSAETDTVLENTSKNYLVPIIQGSTFTWSAVGGTIGSPVGNAVKVDWGTALTNAKILVTEKDAGNCSYTNERNVVIISIVGVKDEENMIGMGYAYPNPANTTVTIPLVIDGNWNVDLSLYDMTGKKVKEIYNGAVSGNRDFTFAVDDLQNGMYIYKVSTSDGYESVKKLNIAH
ncbi:MAG TPA: hypothetical protein DCX54_13460 [Flavobacteriales bacterium]|nr:hypothetical protein [Flavobacteriales bacterium]